MLHSVTNFVKMFLVTYSSQFYVQGSTATNVHTLMIRETTCIDNTLPFVYMYLLQVWVSVNPIYCSDRSAEYHRQLWLSGGPPQLQDLLWHGPPGCRGKGNNGLDLLQPPVLGGLEAVRPLTGWSHIHIPGE